jgi:hypothetical protein
MHNYLAGMHDYARKVTFLSPQKRMECRVVGYAKETGLRGNNYLTEDCHYNINQRRF